MGDRHNPVVAVVDNRRLPSRGRSLPRRRRRTPPLQRALRNPLARDAYRYVCVVAVCCHMGGHDALWGHCWAHAVWRRSISAVSNIKISSPDFAGAKFLDKTLSPPAETPCASSEITISKEVHRPRQPAPANFTAPHARPSPSLPPPRAAAGHHRIHGGLHGAGQLTKEVPQREES